MGARADDRDGGDRGRIGVGGSGDHTWPDRPHIVAPAEPRCAGILIGSNVRRAGIRRSAARDFGICHEEISPFDLGCGQLTQITNPHYSQQSFVCTW
jgi:hypothetical protein